MATDRPLTETQTDLPPMPEIDGLTPQRWRVYVTMIDLRERLGRGVTLAEIGRALAPPITPQAVQKHAWRLVELGLVDHHPHGGHYHRYVPVGTP